MTQEASTVGDLFERNPAQFGMRGDAYLWQALRTELAETPLPPTWFDLRPVIAAAIERITGTPLHTSEETVYVPGFDPGHGLSAGQVHLAWWRQTGIPILIDRFEDLTTDKGH